MDSRGVETSTAIIMVRYRRLQASPPEDPGNVAPVALAYEYESTVWIWHPQWRAPERSAKERLEFLTEDDVPMSLKLRLEALGRELRWEDTPATWGEERDTGESRAGREFDPFEALEPESPMAGAGMASDSSYFSESRGRFGREATDDPDEERRRRRDEEMSRGLGLDRRQQKDPSARPEDSSRSEDS
jgi:hypothetical protein